jgi:hypothetical protein
VINQASDPNLLITKTCIYNPSSGVGFDNHVFTNFMTQVMGVAGRPSTLWPLLGNAYIVGQEWELLINKDPNFNTGIFMYFSGQVPTGPPPAYGHSQTPYQIITDHKNPLLTLRSYSMEPTAVIHYANGADYVKHSPGYQFNPALDRLSAWYGDPATTVAKIWYPFAYGGVAYRLYNYNDNPNDTYAAPLGTRQASGGAGVRHYIYQDEYKPMALSFQLMQRTEKYSLQPRLNSPYYGPFFYTAARTGSYGNMLLVGSLSEMPYPATGTMSIDLTPCRQAGGSINRYWLTPRKLTAVTLAGNPTADAVQFNTSGEGGELFFYTCQVAGAAPDIDMAPFNPPKTLPFGATQFAIKVGYYPDSVDESDATPCTGGCIIGVEHTNARAWYKKFYLAADNTVLGASDAEPIPAQNP